MSTMNAMVYTEYGSPEVLHLQQVEKPAPKDNEVLVKIHATTVTFGDLMARNFKAVTPRTFNMPTPLLFLTRFVFGFSKPKINILGAEYSGTIEAIGSAVTRFKVGDEVYGYLGANMGANAEYRCVPEAGSIALKPKNMSFPESAAIPYGAIMAVPLLQKVNIQRGQKILINGASGSIGAMAVQLAKHYGAEVTGVCGTQRVDYVKALGADHVIDYTQEDFTQNGEHYDVIFDILGKASYDNCKNSLTENGILLYASFKLNHLFHMLRISITNSKQKVICALADEKAESLSFVRDLIESGAVKSVIDRCYPLEELAEAHRYAESGQKKASVIITI